MYFNNKMSKKDIKLSKTMSAILRHKAIENGLQIKEDGYIKLSDLLKCEGFKGISVSNIINVVENSDKKRFEISEDGKYIRATQGHSIKTVKTEELLRELTEDDGYTECYHGTNSNTISSIMVNGLNRMKRNNIHFSIGLKEDDKVISGMRNSAKVVVVLDLQAAMEHGIKFYISSNNVILSEGVNGIIPPEFIKDIIYL